jgi:tetratricopeptide (TPR) repeat protein
MGRSTSRLGSVAALGAALAGHGAVDAKTEDFGKVRMTGPDPIAGASAEAARALGRALLAQNNPTQALQAYRQALAQDPESVDALNGIAVCFDRLGRFEDARLHYETALGIDPTSPVLLNNYGLSLFLQGDRQGAERFLRLAAAAGDPDVQAASLRTLARIEREAPNRAAVRTAAAEPEASGPRILRTSGHEQRLVLDQPKTPAKVQMAAALSPERAMLAVAIGGLSAEDDNRIASLDRAAIEADERARARTEAEREAHALLAEARAMVPAEMQVAAMLAAAREAAIARDEAAEPVAPAPAAAGPSFGPAPSDTDWHRDQILIAMPGSGPGGRRAGDRAAMRMALLATGFAPPPPAQRDALVAAALAALQSNGPRRSFPAAFQSDDDRLNGFAERVQGLEAEPEELTVAEKVARLEALIERVRSA